MSLGTVGGGRVVDMVDAPPSPSVDAPLAATIVDEQVMQFLRGAISMRAAGAPLLLIVVGVVAWIDPTLWRRLALLGLVLVGIAGSAVVELRVRRIGVEQLLLPVNLVGTAIGQLLVVTLTGGVDSPLLPIVIPYTLLGVLVLGRRPATASLVVLQIAALTTLTTVQSAGWAPFLDLPHLYVAPAARRIAAGTVVIGIVVFGSALGLAVRRRFEAMVSDAIRSREEQLATWVDWSRDLEAMGGEIAHELKNPLASVKGLSALVARDLPEGRSVERMTVLQGEVERMREILEEFLTFSRPLSPLTVVDVDPVELAGRVVALHEGAARSAGVGLRTEGRARSLRGDPRKLLQVLINLVQNALAASERGAEVLVYVGEEEGRVVFEVRDQGAGLDPMVAERGAFHAGVTNRADGSGLGLTIALAIARQHEGELSLEDRDEGGVVARLVLP